jgi:serine/threonine-protein kinase
VNPRDQLIAGRYEVGERLGFGGMSTVNIAFDRRLERQVAVKLLAEHLAEDPQFVSRFRREALAAARLVHPNIVQVFDFGLDEPSGRHFIVMEYIRGKSGAELLRDADPGHPALELGEAIDIVDQSCRGLEHAHRHGVVHRDVKPGNLLRSDDGVVKLADFGIAKAGDAVSSITQVGSCSAPPAYLAPEQASGAEATARSDIYSLGVVAYQLIAGRLPYEAQSLTELALKQQREEPPMLDELDRRVPHGVAQAVASALELEPARRPQSADEFRRMLATALPATPSTSSRPRRRASSPPIRPARPSSVAGTRATPRRAACSRAPGPPAPPSMYQSRRPRAPRASAAAEASSPRCCSSGSSPSRRSGLYLALNAGTGTERLPDVTRETVGDTVSRMQGAHRGEHPLTRP